MLNFYAAAGFGAVLVLVGILGFVVPADKGLTSGAKPYNVFHIVFGLVGIAIALTRHDAAIRAFNVGFGAIDLYQAVASGMNWWPKAMFQWKRADDVLHVVFGLALVAIGIAA